MELSDLIYHPPGTERPLLNHINMKLPAQSLGLIIGRSGSGKTTLLQVIAGLSQQTEGEVNFIPKPKAAAPQVTPSSGSPGSEDKPKKKHGPAWRPPRTPPTPSPPPPPPPITPSNDGPTPGGALAEERMKRVGLVFQFPERHFLGESVFDELTFGWLSGPEHYLERQYLAMRVQQVLQSVGLEGLSMQQAPTSLSGGQQRRLALAIQLIRQPSVLLLDEPLAGLDWQARAEVVGLLKELKKQCALLVVSHDLREVAPLVDHAWEMKDGGSMGPVAWPPVSIMDESAFFSMASTTED